jgi:ATP-dependent DNA helicase RecQ
MTLKNKPKNVLKQIFGHQDFRPQQDVIIDTILKGQSCLVLMPTGGGKSLCYQIPALCLDGVAVVISPLIALMDDQIMSLQALGIRAATLHSGCEFNQIIATEKALRHGDLDLLYIAPERLSTPAFQNLLEQSPISLFAVDEAHCMSTWGHDFRPDYQLLSILAQKYAHIPRIAVTATADRPTRHDICEQLGISKIFNLGFDRPNIFYHIEPKTNPKQQLLHFLEDQERGSSGIIYALSRDKVEKTAMMLQEKGYHALPYHAGLPISVRQSNQSRFLNEEGVIIVATIAFGMGINKSNVRFVAHIDLPKNIESYYQETGRAGRDGLPANVWMTYNMQDMIRHREMIATSNALEDRKSLENRKLDALLGLCETAQCRRQIILRYFEEDGGDPCGHCDICHNPPETYDGTIAAQKILSCIYRTGQMFGAAYVVDVLLGIENERILKNGHNALSVFGIGKDHIKTAWQSMIRQLIAVDYIRADMNKYGGLVITELGKEFLQKRNPIDFRLDKTANDPVRKEMAEKSQKPILVLQKDRDLFEHLRATRLKIAKENNVPPYVIFHDTTLIDMARLRPATEQDLMRINGVGSSKADKYGDEFISAIASFGVGG